MVGGQWVRFGVQIVGIVALSRLLTPSDYGVLAMVLAVTGVATIVSDFGLSLAVVQQQDITQDQQSNVFWINAGVGVILAGFGWIMAPLLAEFYGDSRVTAVTRALAIVFVLYALTSQFRAVLTRRFAFGALALSDVVAQILALAVSVGLALAGWGYWALVAQQLVLSITPLAYLAAASRWIPGLPRRAPMRSLLGFGARTTAVQLLNYASDNADSIVLGRSTSSNILGYYNRAYQLLLLPMQQIAAPLGRVALPVLSRISDTAQYSRYVERAQRMLVYLLGLVYCAAACLADPLVQIALGSQWVAAVPLFRLLTLIGVAQAMGILYSWIYLSKARTDLQLRVALIARPLAVIFVIVGATWGAEGVAMAMSVGAAMNWLIHTLYGVPRTGVAVRPLVRVSVRPVVLYVVATAIVLPVMMLMQGHVEVWPLLAIGVALLVATLVALGAFVPAVRRDMRELREMIRLLRRGPDA